MAYCKIPLNSFIPGYISGFIPCNFSSSLLLWPWHVVAYLLCTVLDPRFEVLSALLSCLLKFFKCVVKHHSSRNHSHAGSLISLLLVIFIGFGLLVCFYFATRHTTHSKNNHSILFNCISLACTTLRNTPDTRYYLLYNRK